MSPKEQLLQDVAQALASQTISPQELEALLPPAPTPVAAPTEPPPTYHSQPAEPPVYQPEKSKKALSVIDILFYLAGIILFAALMTMVSQIGEDSLIAKLFISLGVGLMFWSASFVVAKQPNQSEIKEGLVNSMLLTGSLSVIAGGFILTFDLTDISQGSSSPSVALAYAVLLAILGIVHVLFDRLLRNPVLVLFGFLLIIASFPTAIVGLLADADLPADVWGIVGIITGLLFAYGGRVVSSSAEGRSDYKDSFESVAGFIILGSIYVLGFASHIALLWQLLLPLVIYLAFFISIKRRSKQFLVTGSLFLVLFLITMSFKYFAGLGAAFSLILSAFSILATAFVASNINKKYIKS